MHVSHLPFLLLILHLLIIILFLLFTHNNINIVAYASCVEKDRNALLNFKAASLIDDSHQLSSWENIDVDCCLWDGVRCDNRTNHNRVIQLDLSQNLFVLLRDRVVGKMISSSLLELNELRHLDLSFIHFHYSQSIPDFIGSLTKLRYLNLGYCKLVGQIPHSLGNLSFLQTLNLNHNIMLHTNHLGWISSLHSLEYLDLSWINISDGEWLQALNTLPMLKQIHLKHCSLHNIALPISSIHMLNASNSLSVLDLHHNHMSLGSSIFPWLLNHSHSLTYIDLSSNSLNGTIPETLWKLTHLAYIGLSENGIQGTISNTIENLTSLVHLDLSFNQQLQGDFTHLMTHLWNSTLLEHIDLTWNAFFGSLPNMSRFQYLKELSLDGNHLNGSIGEDNLRLPALEILDLLGNKFTGMIPNLSSCVSLRFLYLSYNMFNDTLTESIGNLFQLELLHLGSNQLEGIISEAHLFNLSKLYLLDMSFNSNLTISFNPSSTPPFQLEYIYLSSCRLGPHFPQWLQNQSRLFVLDISNSNIWDTIPNWFWNISDQLMYLNMSHNSIHGTLPPHLSIGASVDLSFNLLHGTLPQISNVTLDRPTHGALILSRNKFSGTVVLCNFPNNYHLDFSNNQLSGHISQDCFKNLSVLSYLNLENNNLSGNIEISHASCHLSSLHLRNNKFSGNIPKSLGACHNFSILDLGENKFFGTIPDWLGESLTKLLVLSLRANQLQGSLPSGICRLSRIQVLDISRNELSGTIPKCINNLTMLSTKSQFNSTNNDFHQYIYRGSFYESFRVNWKGQNSEYIHTLWALKAIDFSCNKFSGEIPIEITRLVELVSLNLSRNNLIGSIPRDINRLKQLDVLDLSWNNLSGAIPSTLSQLSLLGTLNLSFNNLSGKIPWVNHLATFDNVSYLGNPRLCGPPLVSQPCPDDGGIFKKPIFMDRANKDLFKTRELYISMTFGFIFGFWGAFGTLLFNKAWNISLIKVYSRIDDWIYVIVRLNRRHL